MRENLIAGREYPISHVMRYVKEVRSTSNLQEVVQKLQEQRWIVISACQHSNGISWVLGRVA